MQQPDFFAPPIARKRDPETSRIAAVQYTNRDADKSLLLDLIQRRPGHTAAEYSQILFDNGMDFYKAARMPTKRVHDLVHDGVVRVGGIRQCGKTKRKAQTYYGVSHQ